MDRLSAEGALLEKESTAATERTALARKARDEAARALLRLEPVGGLGRVVLPLALGLGMASGVTLSWWWLSLPFSERFPFLAAVASLGVSAAVLLRGAWHAGRVTGARGPD